MGPYRKTRDFLLSQAASSQVSSAMKSLTTVFEMGTGVSSSLLSRDFSLLVIFPYCFVSFSRSYQSRTLVRSFIHSLASSHYKKLTSQKVFIKCTFKTEQRYSKSFNHWSSVRPISIGQLNVSPHLHLRPINVIVSHGSYLFREGNLFLWGASHLDAFSAYPVHR